MYSPFLYHFYPVFHSCRFVVPLYCLFFAFLMLSHRVLLALQVCRANPQERGRFIRVVYQLVQSTSSAVRYEAAKTLTSISHAPTAVKAAAQVGFCVCVCGVCVDASSVVESAICDCSCCVIFSCVCVSMWACGVAIHHVYCSLPPIYPPCVKLTVACSPPRRTSN